MSEHLYVIYDERALAQGTDKASVLEACGTLREVIADTTWDGVRDPLGVVAEYDVVPKDGANCLENERIIGTVPQLQKRYPDLRRGGRR